jgi:hypothetical protein
VHWLFRHHTTLFSRIPRPHACWCGCRNPPRAASRPRGHPVAPAVYGIDWHREGVGHGEYLLVVVTTGQCEASDQSEAIPSHDRPPSARSGGRHASSDRRSRPCVRYMRDLPRQCCALVIQTPHHPFVCIPRPHACWCGYRNPTRAASRARGHAVAPTVYAVDRNRERVGLCEYLLVRVTTGQCEASDQSEAIPSQDRPPSARSGGRHASSDRRSRPCVQYVRHLPC